MSRYVRMLHSLSGSRYDDRSWRDYPAGSLIEVPDWEADLITVPGGAAVEVPPEELPAPVPPPQPEPQWAPNGELITPAPAPEPEPEPEPEPDEAVVMPRGTDSKQAWVDYAVSQGADPGTAASMTKIDLQSRYGGRL